MPESLAAKKRRTKRKTELPKYLTVAEFSTMTGYPEEWIREQVRRGNLEHAKVASRIAISVEGLKDKGFRFDKAGA